MITQVVVILKLDMYNGLGYILPIIILSISYNIVKFFEVETVFYEVSESTGDCFRAFAFNRVLSW